jgi:hypothetical protein
MATRASEQEVKEIIDTALTVDQITPFLRAANRLINDALADEGYGAELLHEIECWLTAHFIASRDPRTLSETIGDASATFWGTSGLGLNGTSYGQNVMLLEHHGKLAQITEAKGPAEVKVIQ